MDKNTIRSSTANHQDSSGTHQDNLELPPPYSPTQQQQPQYGIPSSPTNTQQSNISTESSNNDTRPSAPSLYPDIPQRLPHNVAFPMPQPYNPQHHHTTTTPLYQQQQPVGFQQPGVMYGSTHHSPPSPGGFHTIYIPGHQTSTQVYRFAPPTDSIRRPFPIGALIFIFGWAFPPLWILGACCCAASRNPYEAWWARLNLVMGLLVLMSSLIYSMLAILAGDWYIGLQWMALRQET